MDMRTFTDILGEGQPRTYTAEMSLQKNVSDALLSALSNIQSALLKLKEPNEGPTLLKTVLIRVLVNR